MNYNHDKDTTTLCMLIHDTVLFCLTNTVISCNESDTATVLIMNYNPTFA